MFRRAQQAVFAALLTLSPCIAGAQTTPQPSPVPAVTAEKTSWFLAREPIVVNGELYYPFGPVQFFNRHHMIRSGSFSGIPLYTDASRQPESLVFVPLPGERVQPYQRPQPGVLVGTTGSVPSVGSLPAVAGVQTASDLLQEVATAALLREVAAVEPRPVGTSGRVLVSPAPSRVTTLNPPTGLNGIWINFDGRRWFSAGKAIDFDPEGLIRVGTYHGWHVYMRNGDRTTIYVPAVPGKLSPYRAR